MTCNSVTPQNYDKDTTNIHKSSSFASGSKNGSTVGHGFHRSKTIKGHSKLHCRSSNTLNWQIETHEQKGSTRKSLGRGWCFRAKNPFFILGRRVEPHRSQPKFPLQPLLLRCVPASLQARNDSLNGSGIGSFYTFKLITILFPSARAFNPVTKRRSLPNPLGQTSNRLHLLQKLFEVLLLFHRSHLEASVSRLTRVNEENQLQWTNPLEASR